MQAIHSLLLVILVLHVSGCNLTNKEPQGPIPSIPASVFNLNENINIETEQQIFYLDSDTRKQISELVANTQTNKDKVSTIIHAIFDHSSLNLAYSIHANTVAQQTFNGRQANCLSLTILAFSMLEEIGIKANFQEVLIPEFWTQRDGNTLINHHVNLKIVLNGTKYLPKKRAMTIDFNPQQINKGLKTKVLNKKQIVSKFYANKGAEYLIKNNYDLAFLYLSNAVKTDPNNNSAWLNLGVVFARQDMLETAKEFYEYSITLNPDFVSGYENLALLLRKQGKHVLAEKQLARLHRQRLSNPYYHLMLGDKDALAKNFNQAIKHYKSALKINHDMHQVYFSLAKAYFELDNIKSAKYSLRKAKNVSNDANLQQVYSSKLNALYSF